MRTPKPFAALVLGFFVLYALTAQRGLGWGDSGLFQHWALKPDWPADVAYPLLHPLYLGLVRLVAPTPHAVTLVSSFFGALAVGGLFLVVRKVPLAVLFGLSHMLWWNSCVAEVQTMNLAFLAFETWLLLRAVESGRTADWMLLFGLSGLHLEVHNLALLCLPVYLAVAVRSLRLRPMALAAAILCWTAGAFHFLFAAVRLLAADGAAAAFRGMLVGDYGAQVCGLLPSDPVTTGFNFALAALSFVVPVLLVWMNRGGFAADRTVLALFAVNALFWVRYFVPDQAMFLLPTLFFAYVLLRDVALGTNRTLALALLQVLLPVAACLVLADFPRPADRPAHGDRDDAAYFALPWKMNENSADRLHRAIGGTWDGYPE